MRTRHARPMGGCLLAQALLLVVCAVCGVASTAAPVAAQAHPKNPPTQVPPTPTICVCGTPCAPPGCGGTTALCVSGGGPVTWPENTTGHRAAYTVQNCGPNPDSWTPSCSSTGPVTCNYISSSCTSAPPGQSCSSTITYSVGAVGSGSVTLNVVDANGNQYQDGATTVTVQAGPPEVAVTTYHYDNYRTGWNQHEQTLTPTNVVPGSFGLLYTIALDDEVDAQPLVVPHVRVNTGPYAGTTHDIVYVATENNTVYAIEPSTGTLLFSRHLAPPDPNVQNCGDGPYNMGITGTPTIDLAYNTLYVIDYRDESGTFSYHLHALDLGTLNDNVNAPSGVTVVGDHTVANGTFQFNGYNERQRPALLEANGTIYAGFGSFCDNANLPSRGWLLGWQVPSLTSLNPNNQLNDTQCAGSCGTVANTFLSSIWMSGYGPAADSLGNVYFVTGNTPYPNHNAVTNISESVVKLRAGLDSLPRALFTSPKVDSLDQQDQDFGAGGVMLLPDNAFPGFGTFAVVAGKEDGMYLLRRSDLGAPQGSIPNPSFFNWCWCGESYFNGQVVSSGGDSLMLWNVNYDIHGTPGFTLANVVTVPGTFPGDPGGFFTTVSSNGTQAGTGIIWAVTRPYNVRNNSGGACPAGSSQSLIAYNPANLSTLFSETAAPCPDVHSFIMPVVANGLAFVAAAHQLSIFGLGGQ